MKQFEFCAAPLNSESILSTPRRSLRARGLTEEIIAEALLSLSSRARDCDEGLL